MKYSVQIENDNFLSLHSKTEIDYHPLDDTNVSNTKFNLKDARLLYLIDKWNFPDNYQRRIVQRTAC